MLFCSQDLCFLIEIYTYDLVLVYDVYVPLPFEHLYDKYQYVYDYLCCVYQSF